MPFLLAAGVLAAGFLGNVLPGHAPASVAPVVPVSSGTSVAAAVAGSAETVPGPPRVVDCGRMPAYQCSAAVLAAREALGGADVSIDSARAWPTLVCGDDLDCPRALLARSDPVGSVTLSLADGRGEVWVNVLRVPAPTRLNETGERLVAQVIRWFHGGYLEPLPLPPG